MLQDEVFGRDVVFVGNDSCLDRELLWRLERGGSGDEVSGETTRQKVARRAGYEKEHAE